VCNGIENHFGDGFHFGWDAVNIGAVNILNDHFSSLVLMVQLSRFFFKNWLIGEHLMDGDFGGIFIFEIIGEPANELIFMGEFFYGIVFGGDGITAIKPRNIFIDDSGDVKVTSEENYLHMFGRDGISFDEEAGIKASGFEDNFANDTGGEGRFTVFCEFFEVRNPITFNGDFSGPAIFHFKLLG
jgi:hypothetical protein